jgi:dipeptidyl aminopeptidase/acylaminoacyl peptidase
MSEIATPSLPVGGLQVSPDGRHISWAGSRGGPIPHDLFVLPVAGSEPRNLTALSIDRSVDGYVWLDEESVLVQVSDGFATVFYTVSIQGKSVKRSGFEVEPSGSFFARKGTLAFVGETATAAPELWMSEASGEARLITELNSDWDLPLIQPRLFRYQSFDGTSIEAALLMPDGAREGVRLPLVVLVHGGPTGRWRSRVNAWGQLLAARGIAVLFPNIRGSTGYGHDLLTANHRDWGGADFKDVMAGVDYLIEEGTADPDRLGIGGWSYGGYMAAWAVTQTDRFKASVSGAPMTDLAFEYGSETAGINAYDSWFLGTPYENLDLFIERSPVTHVRNVKTPTLLLCAENDVIDPVEQCQQFYRGLRRYDVETSYVVYPREGHGIREEKHTIDLANRLVEWFVRYLEP